LSIDCGPVTPLSRENPYLFRDALFEFELIGAEALPYRELMSPSATT